MSRRLKASSQDVAIKLSPFVIEMAELLGVTVPDKEYPNRFSLENEFKAGIVKKIKSLKRTDKQSIEDSWRLSPNQGGS